MQSNSSLWPNLFPAYTSYDLSSAPVKVTKRTRMHSLRVYESGVIPGCYGVGSSRLSERSPNNPSWVGSMLTIPYKSGFNSAREERLAALRDISSTWLYSYGAHGTNNHHSSPKLPLDDVPGLYEYLKRTYPSLPRTINLVEQLHGTCSGVKVCPVINEGYIKSFTHTDVSTKDLADQIESHDRKLAEGLSSPFSLSLMYYQMLYLQGCRHRQAEETLMSREELKSWDEREKHLLQLRRGQKLAEERCHGKLALFDDVKGNLYVRCEHFHSKTSPAHRFERVTMNLHHGYLRALFGGNQSATFEYEIECFQDGYGPLFECLRYENPSSTSGLCNGIHRGYGNVPAQDGDSHTQQGLNSFPAFELLHSKCKSSIRILFPEDRQAYPFALILTRNAHEHPIPTPSTTPEPVNRAMRELIKTMGDDIPGLTPRKLTENAVMLSYLRKHFPGEESYLPGLLHPSLYNKDRLQRLIDEVRDESFPDGMNEIGLRRLAKERHDYVVAVHPDRNDEPHGPEGFIAVLMTPWMTQQLRDYSPFLMLDTSFKLIAGQYTMFGIALKIEYPFTKTITVSRAITIGESADTIYKVLQMVDCALHQRTGYGLVFRITRPLNVPYNVESTALVTMDLGKGQALGLGRLLLKQMQMLSDEDVECLHNTGVFPRSISAKELTEYEILSYIQRACVVHGKRNVDKLSAPLELKFLCLSLYEHKRELHVDETEKLMANAGTRDWYLDKWRSSFALQAMGSKSQVPAEIFHAGHKDTNAIESTHQNILRSGKGVSLVQAVILCERFDRAEEASVINRLETGVGARDGKSDLKRNMNLNDRRNVSSHQKAVLARAQSASSSSCTDELALTIPPYHRYLYGMQHKDLDDITSQIRCQQLILGIRLLPMTGNLTVRLSRISIALNDIDSRLSNTPGQYAPRPTPSLSAMDSLTLLNPSSTLVQDALPATYFPTIEVTSLNALDSSIPPSIELENSLLSSQDMAKLSSFHNEVPHSHAPSTSTSFYSPSPSPTVPSTMGHDWESTVQLASHPGSSLNFQYSNWVGSLPNTAEAAPGQSSDTSNHGVPMGVSSFANLPEEEDPNAHLFAY